ncbi:hypothetical protein [Nostoc sp.]|uniref:hypothetical protein n=1 Tax=Nostoc sp. TaxID=1180 RepID=UPI002FF8B24A
MPNPPNDVELIQQFCLQYVNKSVRGHFKDLDEIAESELTTTNSRHVAKMVSLHKDKDPITLTVARLLCFYFSMGDFESSSDLLDTEKYIPAKLRQYHPQIKLYFIEDLNDVEPGYSRLDGTISFRLMSENSETLSKTDLERYGNKIKSIFGAGSGLIWKKGKTMYVYADWDRGYQLQLLCRNTSDAKNLIQKTLDIQNHTPDWKYLSFEENAEPAEKYPTIPGHKTILGKQIKDSRSRPICEVKFKESMIRVPGLKNLICLYDRTGYRRNPIVHK